MVHTTKVSTPDWPVGRGFIFSTSAAGQPVKQIVRQSVMSRFNENHILLDDFATEFLVCCPRCHQKARVAVAPKEELIVRLTCNNCGNLQDWECTQPGVRMWSQNPDLYEKGVISIGSSVDWCFHLPLWLRIECCGHELWAYNYEHLEWLEKYVGARLRERTKDDESGWRNQSLASRLPKWIKQAKNREDILRAIKKLREESA